MKKAFYIVVIASLLTSCMTNTDNYPEPPSQKAVSDFLREKRMEFNNPVNSIQEKEFKKKFEEDFCHYIDSLRLVTNWRGTITSIHQKEVGDAISLQFTLRTSNLFLSCQHLVDKADKDGDQIYQKIFNMADGTFVVFDGFARTKNDGTLYWKGNDSYRMSIPEFEFWVTDIENATQKDTISNNLYDACMLVFDSVELMKKKDSKELSQAAYNKAIKEMRKANEDAKALLTDEEVEYLVRLSTDLYYDYTY